MNIRLYRGDSRTWELTVTDSSGSTFNLAGAAVWFTVKRDPDDPDDKAVISKATANIEGGADTQILITDEEGGQAEIYLLPEDTENLKIPSYDFHYDVQVKTPGSKPYTVISGRFRLLRDVSHSSATS